MCSPVTVAHHLQGQTFLHKFSKVSEILRKKETLMISLKAGERFSHNDSDLSPNCFKNCMKRSENEVSAVRIEPSRLRKTESFHVQQPVQ